MSISRYYYTDIPPTPCHYESITFLNRLTEKSIVNLVAACMLQQDYRETVEALAHQDDVDQTQLLRASTTLRSIIQGVLLKDLTPDQIMSDLTQLGLEKDKLDVILKLCKKGAKTPENVKIVNSNTHNRVDLTKLVDLEWKFGVTAASSELDKVGVTFLQLKLTVANSTGALEYVHLELTLPEFYNFLHELEKAKSSMEFLP